MKNSKERLKESMQGIDIAREFYLKHGRAMIEENFPEYESRIAVGLAGEGSECLGFDDEISHDHDFEAGFCLWITKEDERKFGFKLERAYAKLPKEFMGLKKSIISPAGGNRHGVITIEDFYTRFLGAKNAPDNIERWLYTPPCSLLSASNGEVFRDDLGLFSEVREKLLLGYPEDIRLKKLAAHTVFMAQSGQYNYPRCIAREDGGSAQLAVFEFVKHAISAIYLLNNSYEPFYKWAYKGLERLPILSDISPSLQALTELDNSKENAETKQAVIEDICALFITEFKKQNLSKAICTDLEKHAFSILDCIRNANLRNMHIMEGV